MSNLDELFDAWDKDTGGGRDAARARQICDEYVAKHSEDFADLLALETPDKTDEQVKDELVAMVDGRREAAAVFRSAGMEYEAQQCDADKLRIDVWIMHRVEPQNIGGAVQAKLRKVNL
jgi:hypothetical protein